MSNTQTPTNPPRSLERYRQDAAKQAEKAGGPFRLHVDDDNVIEVPRPNGATMFAVEEATSSKQVIRLLAGDRADELIGIFEGEDFAVMTAVVEDMQQHFGIDTPGA